MIYQEFSQFTNLDPYYLYFFLIEKTTEKKHLKEEKHKGNTTMKISANISFFMGSERVALLAFLNIYKYTKMVKLCINPQSFNV